MQDHTFQPNKKMKEIFVFYPNAYKVKRKNVKQVKNQEKKSWPKRRSQRITSKNHKRAI
jgi:hypothetical protein